MEDLTGRRVEAVVGVGAGAVVEGTVTGEGKDWRGRFVWVVRKDDGHETEVLPEEMVAAS